MLIGGLRVIGDNPPYMIEDKDDFLQLLEFNSLIDIQEQLRRFREHYADTLYNPCHNQKHNGFQH